MSTRRFTVHINGHAGHRGNVLAFAFLERVRAVLAAFAHAERNYLNVPNRLTDYEIIDAAKVNPTELTLVPISVKGGYDPLPALDWTLEQIERIARGDAVDEKVDEALARDFIKIVPADHHTGATGVYITTGGTRIDFDKSFRQNSEAIAQLRKVTAKRPDWAVTKSRGSVVGILRQVDDWEGKAEFSIEPPVGAHRINCKFPDHLRIRVQESLFRTARFHGALHYRADSPFPYLVEVDDIEIIQETPDADRLYALRGMFEGRLRIEEEAAEALRDL